MKQDIIDVILFEAIKVHETSPGKDLTVVIRADGEIKVTIHISKQGETKVIDGPPKIKEETDFS